MTNQSALPGWNMLLMGPSGVGKTYSIRTLVDSGVIPFCIFTEPGFEVLGDIPPEKLHWNYIRPATSSWETDIDNHKKLNQFSFKALADMAPADKKDYHQFIDFLSVLNNYTCQRTGENFGNTMNWNTDRCLVVDGLSGVGIMAMREWIGSKSLMNQGDWGVAMQGVETFVQKLCIGTQCHTVLIAHVERETDDQTGSTKVMASTLGKKLAPKLPRFFSDVVLAKRTGTKFEWDTADPTTDLKSRNLPLSSHIEPDFKQVMAKWKAQGGTIHPTEIRAK